MGRLIATRLLAALMGAAWP